MPMYPLPGQTFDSNGVSNFIFGVNGWGSPAMAVPAPSASAVTAAKALFTGMLVRTFFTDATTDTQINSRLGYISSIGGIPMICLQTPTNATFNAHVVSFVGNKCKLYEFANEPDGPNTPLSVAALSAAWDAQIPHLRSLNSAAAFIGCGFGGGGSYVGTWINNCKASGVIPDAVSLHTYPCGPDTGTAMCLSHDKADFSSLVQGVKNQWSSTFGTSQGPARVIVSEWNVNWRYPMPSWCYTEPFVDTFYNDAISSMIAAGAIGANQFALWGGSNYSMVDTTGTKYNFYTGFQKAVANNWKPGVSPPPPPPPTNVVPHLMLITIENQEYGYVRGNTAMPHINNYMNTFGNCTNFWGCVHPSCFDYVATAAGSTFGLSSDSWDPAPNPLTSSTIVDQLIAKGIDWRHYAEYLPNTGYLGGDSGTYPKLYVQHHNPWVYFRSIRTNASQYNKIITLDSGNNNTLTDFANLTADLDAGRCPPFVMVQPGNNHNAHTGTDADCDNFIYNLVTMVMTKPWYTQNQGMIMLWWDEGDKTDSNGIGDPPAAGGHTACVVISEINRGIAPHVDDVNHYGMLRAIEELYGLGFLNYAANTRNGDLSPMLTMATTPPPGPPPQAKIPGQTFVNGVSNFIFGTNMPADFAANTTKNTPAIQQHINDANFTLMRVSIADGVSDVEIDARVAACVACDTKILATLPTNSPAFSQHVVRYLGSRCNLYELGNEPDLAGVTTAQYLGFWTSQIPSLRAINPNAGFIGPALGVFANLTSFVKPWLQGCVTNGVYPDGVSYHVYPCTDPATTQAACAPLASNFQGNATTVRNLIESIMPGSGVAVCLTEWNIDATNPPKSYTVGSPFNQTFTHQALDSMVAGNIDIACQFDAGSYCGFGLLDLVSTNAPYNVQVQYQPMVDKIVQYLGTSPPPPPPPPPPTGPLQVSQSTITLNGTVGTPIAGSYQIILTNVDAADQAYTASDNQPWITVSPTSDTVVASGNAVSTITVSYTPAAAGTYNGSITYTTAGGTVSVTVTIAVTSSGGGGNPLLVGPDTPLCFTDGTKTNADWPAQRYADLLNMGVRWFRWMPQAWDIELTQGVYTWPATLDTIIQTCNSKGINLMFAIERAPAWGLLADGKPSPQWTLNFAKALMNRYDGKHGHGSLQGIELGNEDYALQTDAPGDLANTMNVCYGPLKSAYPNLIIGPGAHMGRDPKSWQAWVNTMWSQAKGNFDYMNKHYYCQNQNSSDPSVSGGTTFMSWGDMITIAKNGAVAAGKADFPFWVTEVGWPINTNPYAAQYVVSPQTQANYLKYCFDYMRTNVPNGKISVFTLGYAVWGVPTTGVGQGQGMSVYQVNYAGNPLPAYTMIKNYPENWGGGTGGGTIATKTRDMAVRSRIRVGAASAIQDFVAYARVKRVGGTTIRDVQCRASVSGSVYDTFQRAVQPQWGVSTSGDQWVQTGGTATSSIIVTGS